MKYLDEIIEVDVTGFTVAVDSVVVYKVERLNADLATYTTLFKGNCFLTAQSTSKKLFINDIIANDVENFSYLMDYNVPAVKATTGLERYRVTLTVSNVDYSASVDVLLAYRYPFHKAELDKEYAYRNNMNPALAYNFLQGDLLPRIPFKSGSMPLINLFQVTKTQNPFKYYYQFEGGVTGDDVNVATLTNKPNEIVYTKCSDLFWTTSTTGTPVNPKVTFNAQMNENDVIIDIWNHQSTTVTCDGDVSEISDNQYSFGQDNEYAEVYVDDEVIMGFMLADVPQHYQSEWMDVDFDSASMQGFEIKVYNEKETEKGSLMVENIDILQRTKRIRISFDVDYNSTYSTFVAKNFKLEYYQSYKDRRKLFDVAEIDMCPRDYYLIWKDRYASFQSQPFDKVMTYSEDLEYKQATNYKGFTRNINVQLQPKWTLNSGWLDDSVMPYYESMFVSPLVMLYDTKQDELYYVTVSDNSYTEKTFKNNSRKLFNLQVNVVANKKQNIVY